jgi:hypothetical protein
MNDPSKSSTGWGVLSWLLCLAANGVLAMFWTVFGAAAAGNANASAHRFLVISIVAAALPLLGSTALAVLGRFSGAVGVTWLTVPALVASAIFW